MAVLPPNVSTEDFNSAVNEFNAAVGADWVFTSDADLDLYRDPFSTVMDTDKEILASGAVAPASVEEVQAIVRTANKYKIPLFPISTGKNYGYGGPSANLPGSVIVDLKRMDKVIEINEDRNFALVEPGVSYFDLYRHIQERDLKLWIDCSTPGWGGLIGNALDRGIGYTSQFYRDHYNASCGIEVVLANGEIMRTGMGAVPNADTWQEYKPGFGPDTSGLFSQGNFGIVTKMGFRLMPQPEYYRTGMITVPKRQDLIPMVKILNYLSDSTIIAQPFFSSPLNALMQDSDFVTALSRPGGPIDSELDRFAEQNNLHSWAVELQFYGPDMANLAHWEYSKERFIKEIPGAITIEGESFKIPLTEEQLLNNNPPFPSRIRRKTSQGIPNLGRWSRGRSESDLEGKMDGHAGCMPLIPRSGEAIFAAQQVFGEVSREFGLPSAGAALSLPSAWYPFVYNMGFVPLTSSTQPEHNAKMHEALLKMIEVAAQNGWGDYRAPPIYQDAVMDTYSFNNHILRRFNETLKDAADPNGILAPGRGGVWPEAYRSNRKV